MTEKEYYEQNRLGFEGDIILRDFVKDIIEKNKIKKVLEGGTYLGSTTKLFSEMADSVDSIEVNKIYFDSAKKYLRNYKNVNLIFGKTVEIMPKLLRNYPDGNYLFYCDSHWDADNPLLEELKIIADIGHRPHIIIHDFKVPHHPELRYDSYNGQDYDWPWIKDSVEKIYSKDYKKVFNSQATGAKRGVVYIEPN